LYLPDIFFAVESEPAAIRANKRPLAVPAEIKTPGILTIGDSDATGADGVVINGNREHRRITPALDYGRELAGFLIRY
jgi:hypothetical protein